MPGWVSQSDKAKEDAELDRKVVIMDPPTLNFVGKTPRVQLSNTNETAPHDSIDNTVLVQSSTLNDSVVSRYSQFVKKETAKATQLLSY